MSADSDGEDKGEATAEQLEALVDTDEDTSLHDEIASVIAEAEADAEDDTGDTGDTYAKDADDADKDGADKEKDGDGDEKDDKDQDGDGEEKTETDSPDADKGDGKDTDQGSKTGEQDAATQPLTAPAAWSADERQEFGELPRAVQSAVLRRESDRDKGFTQRTQEIAQAKDRYAALDRVFEPHREAFALRGVDPAKLIEQYFAIDASLSRDPAGTIRYLAERAGVDLHTLTEAGPEPDPAIQQLTRQIGQLQTQVNQNLNTQEADKQRLVDENKQSLDTTIEEFSTAVNDDDTLKYPHFEDLRIQMGALIQAKTAVDLKEAYEMALWATPAHRESLLLSQKSASKKEEEAKRRKHADKAKAAGAGIKGSPGGAEPPSEVGSIREELMRAGAGDLAAS